MKTNFFKNLTAYDIAEPTIDKTFEVLGWVAGAHWPDEPGLANMLSTDPTGSQWRTGGFVPATAEGDYVHDLDGVGYMFAIQFNERMLPAKVRDEHVKVMADQIAEREGRKVGRKEWAELRDEVEQTLLPKAFIRRTLVRCMVTKDSQLFIFTSSAKRADDVVALVIALFAEQGLTVKLTHLATKDPVNTMTGLALAGASDDDELLATTSLVLKGNDKETVRIKDRDILRTEYQGLIRSGYRVHEMGMTLYEGGEATASFKLSHSFVLKGIDLSDTLLTEDLAEGGEHAVAWLVCKEYGRLLQVLMGIFGESADEDDEL